ncbi:MAG: S8 family serine peptidase [Phycisphaerales bacterium]|nr:S8 family serine peptidase [Phycisphaerales bacterium]
MMRVGRNACAFSAAMIGVSFFVAPGFAHGTANSAAFDNGVGFGRPDEFGGYSTNHIVVKLAPGLIPADDGSNGLTIDGGAIDDICRAFGATGFEPVFGSNFANQALADAIGLSRTYRIVTPAGTDTLTFAGLLSSVAGVESAEIDGIGGIAEVIPNDPRFPEQWGLHNTGQTGGTPDADVDAPEAWALHTGADDIVVAIIDTGVQATHPDLAGRVLPGWCTYCNPPSASSDDLHGHGTHVSGIFGANTNNATNTAGVNWAAKILPVRVLSAGGTGTESQCAAGITWAADNGADIASLSLQYYTGGQTLLDAVNYAFSNGVLMIAAAGNNRGNTIAFPARFDHCMCVGGTTDEDTWYTSANFGAQMDVSAPADLILSLWRDNGTSTISGTSMATPFVSGTAALLMSYNRTLSIGDIENLLESSADDLGTPAWDQYFGWGRLNTHAALLAAALRGDMNCDGYLNNFDIDPFVLAVSDGAAYSSAFPNCDILRADMNSDNVVNNFDIDGFVAALAGD